MKIYGLIDPLNEIKNLMKKQIEEIIKLSEIKTYTEIAKLYNVITTTISRIFKGLNWWEI